MYYYGGIKEIWDIFIKAIGLSPCDGNQMPNVFPAITEITRGITINCEQVEFWDIINYCLYRVRDEISSERKTRQQKAKMESDRAARERRGMI